MFQKGILDSRDVWRDDLRHLPIRSFVNEIVIRSMNNIDVAARRGQRMASTTVAVDTSLELNYDDLQKVNTAIKYLAGIALPAEVRVMKEVKEHQDGPHKIVVVSVLASHVTNRELKFANLSSIRRILRKARKDREDEGKAA